jgi:hypothetical protein
MYYVLFEPSPKTKWHWALAGAGLQPAAANLLVAAMLLSGAGAQPAAGKSGAKSPAPAKARPPVRVTRSGYFFVFSNQRLLRKSA